MNLRKIANHPLLIRNHFDEGQVRQLAKLLKKDASHEKAVEKFIAEDLSVMSDFEIHKTCLEYKVSSSHREFWLRNGRGIIGLWKKYILLFECRQNQGKKNF